MVSSAIRMTAVCRAWLCGVRCEQYSVLYIPLYPTMRTHPTLPEYNFTSFWGRSELRVCKYASWCRVPAGARARRTQTRPFFRVRLLTSAGRNGQGEGNHVSWRLVPGRAPTRDIRTVVIRMTQLSTARRFCYCGDHTAKPAESAPGGRFLVSKIFSQSARIQF